MHELWSVDGRLMAYTRHHRVALAWIADGNGGVRWA